MGKEKREALERLGTMVELFYRHAELKTSDSRRAKIENAGFRYLRVTVEDVDTGEKVFTFKTWAKPSDYAELEKKLKQAAPLPEALLEEHVTGFSWDEQTGKTIEWDTTQRNIIKREILGGRPKQGGLLPAKAAEYESIAKRFLKSGLSKPEFSREADISTAKIGRALAYLAKKKVSNNRP